MGSHVQVCAVIYVHAAGCRCGCMVAGSLHAARTGVCDVSIDWDSDPRCGPAGLFVL